MAGESNYIGIAMGLDVTDLKSGLSEANKQIQLANSKFKAVSSGMDDWTKSTEGITAKLNQLETVLKAQKSKLAGLRAEYERVCDEQGEGSEAARKLLVQLNNQQAVVNRTERELDLYEKATELAKKENIDFAKALKKVQNALQGVEEEAEEAKEGFTVMKGVMANLISGGISALVNGVKNLVSSFFGLAESTRETRENMNKLETGFTTAGHSAEDAQKTYKELFGVLGDEGQATEAAAHLAQLANNQQDLSKWTNIATGVYATFGDSLPIESLTEAANETAKTGQLTGGLADALNWAGVSEDEFQAKLDGCSSEQERQALITSTLNGLYSEQSDKFKELNSDIIKAREADAALTQSMAELGAVAEPIMTTLKLLAVDLLNSIKPFVELIGTGLKGALEGSAGASGMLAEGIGGILNALIGKVAEMLPTVLNVVVQLVPTIVNALLGALPQLVDVFMQLVTQIINMLGVALPQIVLKIVEIVPQIINNLVAAIPQLLQAAVTLLMAIVQAIPTIINNLLAALPSIITTIIDTVVTAVPMLLQAAIELLMAIIEAIPTIVQAIVTNLPKIINSIIDGVLNALPLLLDAAVEFLMAIVKAIPKIIPPLIGAMPKVITSILNSLGNSIPKIIAAAFDLFFGIIKAIPKIVIELGKNLPQIISAIAEGLADGVSQMAEAGLNLLKGIWEGIKDGASWLKDKITGFAGDVAGWFKDTFKINSPSKLMEDEVGVYVGQGVIPSSPRALSKVKKSLSKFTGYVATNLGDIKNGLALDTSGTGHSLNGGGSTVVNAPLTVNYNGKLSRKQIKQTENKHYTSIKTKLITEGAI